MDRHGKFDDTINKTYRIQSIGPDLNSAYFQTSCDSSYVTATTERMDHYKSTTETVIDENFASYKWLQVSTTQFESLQMQFEQLQETQDYF